jgi:hypothetical protein
MITPSTTFPPITLNADPAKYHALGSAIPRGKPQKTMSNSELKRFLRCPQKWIRGVETKSTDSTEWGDLVDSCVLTPERFGRKFAISPEMYEAKGKKKDDPVELKPWNYQATVCKEWRTAQESAGFTVVKPDDASEAWSAAKRLLEDDRLKTFIESSDKQVQLCIDYTDDETGISVPIKCLVDLVPRKTSDCWNSLGDLKTSVSAQPHAWVSAVFEFGYHMQASLYLDAFNAVTGEKRKMFAHVVQENSAPYETARRLLSEEFINIGRDAYRLALREYCQCLKSGFWPGYDDREGTDTIIDGWRVVEPKPYMLGQ